MIIPSVHGSSFRYTVIPALHSFIYICMFTCDRNALYTQVLYVYGVWKGAGVIYALAPDQLVHYDNDIRIRLQVPQQCI